jgi:hypothetical protein
LSQPVNSCGNTKAKFCAKKVKVTTKVTCHRLTTNPNRKSSDEPLAAAKKAGEQQAANFFVCRNDLLLGKRESKRG